MLLRNFFFRNPLLRYFRLPPFLQFRPPTLNILIIVGSVLALMMILPMRLPGTQVAGVGANWLLIWVVAWSLRRNVVEGAIAGIILGLLQDAMTGPSPTHVISLAVVGALTALLQKQRYIQEDFISVALIVFGMAIISETVVALQLTFIAQDTSWTDIAGINSEVGQFSLGESLLEADQAGAGTEQVIRAGYTAGEIWTRYQRIALSSAIVSSLWGPIISFPLNTWWEWLGRSKEGAR